MHGIMQKEDFSRFIKGGDMSFLDLFEKGFAYRENGILKEPLLSLRDHGMNYVRLRIWHNPENGWCGRGRTLAMAKRVKAAGLDLLLDIFYSDTWTDHRQQAKPAAWYGHGLEELKVDVYHYTVEILQALEQQGTPAKMVQIGNEIAHGMLWEEGRVENWESFVSLLKEGCRAAREVNSCPRIIIHNEYGGQKEDCEAFYGRLIADGLDFDIIGLSFYSVWQGPIAKLQENIYNLAEKFDKKIIVVETGYPWTLENFDLRQGAWKDETTLLPGYPATLEGQYNYLRDFMDAIAKCPNGAGVGLFYWPTEYIAHPDYPSSSENCAFWHSRTGELLPSIKVWSHTVKIGEGIGK